MVLEIRASGGLVFRTVRKRHQILVVHRPRYEDWSLPKGKDDPGESPQAAARREVQEETGVIATIVADLGDVDYQTPQGNPKRVRYFGMRATDIPEFAPNQEVDEVRWLAPDEAVALLSYRFDRQLVSDVDLTNLTRSGFVFLLRHAKAGQRSEQTGPDHLRPLSSKGRIQAEELAGFFAEWGVDRILSSPSLRCRETVEPLADRLGLDIEESQALIEGGGASILDTVDRFIGGNVVLCSHGDVIPAIIDRLARRGITLTSPTGWLECGKASVWRLTVSGGEIHSAHYYPPPAP